jgi:hypothetical protein
LVALFSQKWLSEAKLKAQSEASRENVSNIDFCSEALVLAFSSTQPFSAKIK